MAEWLARLSYFFRVQNDKSQYWMEHYAYSGTRWLLKLYFFQYFMRKIGVSPKYNPLPPASYRVPNQHHQGIGFNFRVGALFLMNYKEKMTLIFFMFWHQTKGPGFIVVGGLVMHLRQ
jgi:hypothetical protein